MNTRAINSASGVILAAQQQGRLAAGIALALDSAGLLMSPEIAAELEATPTAVFRASHDVIVMGLYTTRKAARSHCEALVSREEPYHQQLAWYAESDEEDSPEGLFVVVAGEESDTGYLVTPLTVASAYDEEADE